MVLWEANGIILAFTVDRSIGGGNYSSMATVAVPAFPSYLGSQILMLQAALVPPTPAHK